MKCLKPKLSAERPDCEGILNVPSQVSTLKEKKLYLGCGFRKPKSFLALQKLLQEAFLNGGCLGCKAVSLALDVECIQC